MRGYCCYRFWFIWKSLFGESGGNFTQPILLKVSLFSLVLILTHNELNSDLIYIKIMFASLFPVNKIKAQCQNCKVCYRHDFLFKSKFLLPKDGKEIEFLSGF